jgi:TonB family protein
MPSFWRKLVRDVRMTAEEFDKQETVACDKKRAAVESPKPGFAERTPPTGKPTYRVGNGVKPPKVLRDPDPEYSEIARAQQWQGICVFQMVVDQQGTPSDIAVLKPCGWGLDENAYNALVKWRFRPATLEGDPVPVMITVEIAFHLGG